MDEVTWREYKGRAEVAIDKYKLLSSPEIQLMALKKLKLHVETLINLAEEAQCKSRER